MSWRLPDPDMQTNYKYITKHNISNPYLRTPPHISIVSQKISPSLCRSFENIFLLVLPRSPAFPWPIPWTGKWGLCQVSSLLLILPLPSCSTITRRQSLREPDDTRSTEWGSRVQEVTARSLAHSRTAAGKPQQEERENRLRVCLNCAGRKEKQSIGYKGQLIRDTFWLQTNSRKIFGTV